MLLSKFGEFDESISVGLSNVSGFSVCLLSFLSDTLFRMEFGSDVVYWQDGPEEVEEFRRFVKSM